MLSEVLQIYSDIVLDQGVTTYILGRTDKEEYVVLSLGEKVETLVQSTLKEDALIYLEDKIDQAFRKASKQGHYIYLT